MIRGTFVHPRRRGAGRRRTTRTGARGTAGRRAGTGYRPAVIVRAGHLLLTVLAAAALVTGCGAPTPAPPGPAPAPGTAPDAAAPAVALPWPARSAAEAAGLQAAADGGAQPWLLDPAEVALSYVAAARDWAAADTSVGDPAAAGAVPVTVAGPAGEGRLLTLRQPARAGRGGIWVVTADDPA